MDRSKGNRSHPQGEIARILVEFLEVAVTSVVFLKGVYPNGAFERRRYMNVVVHKAIHPELSEYIHSVVHGLLPLITKGLVDRVGVIFFNGENVTMERFVFKINVNQSYSSRVEQENLEFSLRSFLIKLPFSVALTNTLPPVFLKWEIIGYFLRLPDASSVGKDDAETWIPTDARQWQQPPLITPIKSMFSDPLSLQLYVEHPSLLEPQS